MPRDHASTNQMASEGGECWENPLFFFSTTTTFFVCVGTEMFYFGDLSLSLRKSLPWGCPHSFDLNFRIFTEGQKDWDPHRARSAFMCTNGLRLLVIGGHDDALKKSRPRITLSH